MTSLVRTLEQQQVREMVHIRLTIQVAEADVAEEVRVYRHASPLHRSRRRQIKSASARCRPCCWQRRVCVQRVRMPRADAVSAESGQDALCKLERSRPTEQPGPTTRKRVGLARATREWEQRSRAWVW